MKNFELECLKINQKLDEKFPNKKNSLISASFEAIIYSIENNRLLFLYPPTRYEPKEVMVLKGLKIRLDADCKREYPVSQLLSFMENDCKYYVNDYKIETIGTLLERYEKLLLFIDSGQFENWENEYRSYIEKKYPW
jgi:hypothetical protein